MTTPFKMFLSLPVVHPLWGSERIRLASSFFESLIGIYFNNILGALVAGRTCVCFKYNVSNMLSRNSRSCNWSPSGRFCSASLFLILKAMTWEPCLFLLGPGRTAWSHTCRPILKWVSFLIIGFWGSGFLTLAALPLATCHQ
jgi:hypothetical protein